MDKVRFSEILLNLFPGFEQHWAEEDIHKESDGAFSAHGLLNSFFFFFKSEYSNIGDETIKQFSIRIESIVARDPKDESDVANAICTSFLKMLDYKNEGKVLKPNLGKECLNHINAMHHVSS